MSNSPDISGLAKAEKQPIALLTGAIGLRLGTHFSLKQTLLLSASILNLYRFLLSITFDMVIILHKESLFFLFLFERVRN